MRVFFCAAFLLIAQGALAEAGGYQIVTEEWAPFNYVEGGKLTGISFDVVSAILRLTGDKFPIDVYPGTRSIVMLDTRPKTIMFSLFRTKERESKYRWVGPIVEETIVPYRLKSLSPRVQSLTELRALNKITTRHAGLVPSSLESLGFTNLEKVATESEQLYQMLFAGRTDVIVGDTDLGVRYYLRKLNLDYTKLEKLPIEVVRSDLYIAFSRDSEEKVVTAWAHALQVLRDNGTLKAIIARYE